MRDYLMNAVILILPILMIMSAGFTHGMIFLLLPLAYVLGSLTARIKAGWCFVLSCASVSLVAGLILDPFGLGVGGWNYAIVLEVAAFMLGYFLYRVVGD